MSAQWYREQVKLNMGGNMGKVNKIHRNQLVNTPVLGFCFYMPLIYCITNDKFYFRQYRNSNDVRIDRKFIK